MNPRIYVSTSCAADQTGVVTVGAFTQTASGRASDAYLTVELYTTAGAALRTQLAAGGLSKTFTWETVANGTYYARLTDQDGAQVRSDEVRVECTAGGGIGGDPPNANGRLLRTWCSQQTAGTRIYVYFNPATKRVVVQQQADTTCRVGGNTGGNSSPEPGAVLYSECAGTTLDRVVYDGNEQASYRPVHNSIRCGGEASTLQLLSLAATPVSAVGVADGQVEASLLSSAGGVRVRLVAVPGGPAYPAGAQPRPLGSTNFITFSAVPAGDYTLEATDDNDGAVSAAITVPEPAPARGCTDPDATNYDPDAVDDDGSCAYAPPAEEPVFRVPLLNSLRFVQPAAVDNCAVFETADNVLFCQQTRPGQLVRPRYYQKVAFCDELPVQVLTNYRGGVQALVQHHGGEQTVRTVDFTRVLTLTGEATTAVVLRVGEGGYTRLDAPAAEQLPANLLRAGSVTLAGGATGRYQVRTRGLDAGTGRPYLVLSRAFTAATDPVTASWQRVGPGYDAWQGVLTFGGLDEGRYQVTLRATDPTFEAATALSEPLLLRAELPGTVCVEYGNARHAYGLLFGTGITPRLRVEGAFFRLKPAGTSTVHRGSSGAAVLLASTAQRTLVLQTVGLPDYLHEKLALACRLTALRVNGLPCLSEGAYEKTDLDNYPLSAGTVTLEQLGWLDTGPLVAAGEVDDTFYLAANGQALTLNP